MREAKRGKPAQASCQIKSRTLSCLQDDGKAQDEKDQSIDKVNDGAVEQKEFREGDHGTILHQATVRYYPSAGGNVKLLFFSSPDNSLDKIPPREMNLPGVISKDGN
jgi:hypothetical protein